MTIQQAIGAVIEGNDLTTAQTIDVFSEIMEGRATDAQIAAFIVALRLKGETIDEITGAATVMREKATRVVPASTDFLVDTCGTGGDGAGTFNISTGAALVAAGAGARVAKHGNRSVSSKSGSADVLEALGISVTATPEVMKRCLDEVGICFLFAPSLHKAMKHAIGPRKEIAVRTIFNVLGPLTNPASAPAQLLGVFSPTLVEPLAHALGKLGSTRAYLVHGADGLDEVSLSAETHVAELCDGKVRTYTVKPEDFGFERAEPAALEGGTPQQNAATIRAVLAGEQGPSRDVIVLNAGFALAASGNAATPSEGIEQARQSIDSGAAAGKLEALARTSTAA